MGVGSEAEARVMMSNATERNWSGFIGEGDSDLDEVAHVIVLRRGCLHTLAEPDTKSLFRRHGHPPAGTGLKERFHGGEAT